MTYCYILYFCCTINDGNTVTFPNKKLQIMTARRKKATASNVKGDFKSEPAEKIQIKVSAKGYRNQSKNYTKDSEMFEELITNQFFAPGVKNIKMEFDTDENGGSFCFINDGTPMTKQEMLDAVTVIGCDSANTAGNENGTGIKSAAAYVTKNSNDSILVVASKKRGTVLAVYAINGNGECCTYTACTKPQQEFIDTLLGKFKTGTATAAFNTEISEEEVYSFIEGIPYMFTTGLNRVKFVYNLNNGGDTAIEPFDRLYSSLSDKTTNICEDTSFKHTVKINKNGCTEYRTRKFFCTYQALHVDSVDKKDRDPRDRDWDDYGVHIGYDNGYMPIHIANTETIGLKRHPRFNHFRAAIIAHPVENGEMYYEYDDNNERVLVENQGSVAGIEEWQALISEIGNMNTQKVPNLTRKKNYLVSNDPKCKTPKNCWEGFYYAVVSDLVVCANKWRPDTDYVAKKDKFKDDVLEKANNALKKQDFEHFGSLWKFRFSKKLGTKTVKYQKEDRTILFNFTADSELNQKLLRGGRNGRNGSTDLYVAIEPIIDVFKMNILASTNHTSADIEKSIRVTRDRFNAYYSAEDND